MNIPDDHVKTVCRLGQGATCCSFIVLGTKGFECAKGTPLEQSIRRRRDAGDIGAQGDNCPGQAGAATGWNPATITVYETDTGQMWTRAPDGEWSRWSDLDEPTQPNPGGITP